MNYRLIAVNNLIENSLTSENGKQDTYQANHVGALMHLKPCICVVEL